MGAILDIIAAILKPLSKLWSNRIDKANEPGSKVAKEKEANEKAIADGTGGPRLDGLLDRLHKPPSNRP